MPFAPSSQSPERRTRISSKDSQYCLPSAVGTQSLTYSRAFTTLQADSRIIEHASWKAGETPSTRSNWASTVATSQAASRSCRRHTTSTQCVHHASVASSPALVALSIQKATPGSTVSRA